VSISKLLHFQCPPTKGDHFQCPVANFTFYLCRPYHHDRCTTHNSFSTAHDRFFTNHSSTKQARAFLSLWPTQRITVSDINFHNHGHRRSHECKQDWRNREGDNLDWRKGSSTPFLYFLQMISLSHTTPHAGLYHTQHTRCPLDPHGPQDQYWFHIQIS